MSASPFHHPTRARTRVTAAARARRPQSGPRPDCPRTGPTRTRRPGTCETVHALSFFLLNKRVQSPRARRGGRSVGRRSRPFGRSSIVSERQSFDWRNAHGVVVGVVVVVVVVRRPPQRTAETAVRKSPRGTDAARGRSYIGIWRGRDVVASPPPPPPLKHCAAPRGRPRRRRAFAALALECQPRADAKRVRVVVVVVGARNAIAKLCVRNANFSARWCPIQYVRQAASSTRDN